MPDIKGFVLLIHHLSFSTELTAKHYLRNGSKNALFSVEVDYLMGFASDQGLLTRETKHKGTMNLTRHMLFGQ